MFAFKLFRAIEITLNNQCVLWIDASFILVHILQLSSKNNNCAENFIVFIFGIKLNLF